MDDRRTKLVCLRRVWSEHLKSLTQALSSDTSLLDCGRTFSLSWLTFRISCCLCRGRGLTVLVPATSVGGSLLTGSPPQASQLGVCVFTFQLDLQWGSASFPWSLYGLDWQQLSVDVDMAVFTHPLDQESPDSTGRMVESYTSQILQMFLDRVPLKRLRADICHIVACTLRQRTCLLLDSRLKPRVTSVQVSHSAKSLSANNADGCSGVCLQLLRIKIYSLFSCHAFHSPGLLRSHACCVQLCLA